MQVLSLLGVFWAAVATLGVVDAAEYSSPTYSRAACQAVAGSNFKKLWVGDGYCDSPKYNKHDCDWDGGDCCEDTCQDGSFDCGSGDYECLNPAAGPCPATCEGAFTCDEYQASDASQTCEFLETEFGCNCGGCDCVPPQDPCTDFLGYDCSRYGDEGEFDKNVLCYEEDDAGRIPQLEACCVCKHLQPYHDFLVPWDYAGNVQVEGPVEADVSEIQAYDYFRTGYDYPSLDDACVNVDYASTIFGLAYDDIWICANGVVSYGEAEMAYTPVPIPYSTFPMIAAFWADVDVRCGKNSQKSFSGCGDDGGNAFGYAIITADDTEDPEGQLYIKEVSRHIKALYKPDFTATSVLVATWNAVGYYSLKTDQLNSFQLVLATDAVQTGESFACMYYKDIDWTLGTVSGSTHAQVGFDKGDGETAYAHPDSTTAAIGDIGSDGQVLCYRIDTSIICGEGEVFDTGTQRCEKQGCNVFSADGAFEDPYLQPSTSGGCEFDLVHGANCSLQCVQGRIASAGATMMSTCVAGSLKDPGLSCVSPGIAITPSILTLIEGGDDGELFIQALAQVYDDPVTVAFTVTDAAIQLQDRDGNEITEIHFTAENWADFIHVIVVPVQNSAYTGDVSTKIGFSVASVDTAYSGLELQNVVVSIEDDDFASILAETGGSVSVAEVASSSNACDRSNGGTATVEYVLSASPSTDVTLDFSIGGDNPTLGQICTSSSLVFDASNWDVAQSLVVASVSTDVAEDADATFSIEAAVSTLDSGFAGLSLDDVVVAYLNDDVAGMVVDQQTVIQLYEGGDSVSTDVLLESEPTSDVEVQISSNDTVHCVLSSADPDGTVTLLLGPSATSSSFAAVAVDDDVVESLVVCEFTLATTSDDSNYDALSGTVYAYKYETDVAAFSVAVPVSGYLQVSEGGSNALSARLSSRPFAPVTIIATVSNWDDSIGDAPIAQGVSIAPDAWSSSANKLVVGCPENLVHDSGQAGVVNATIFDLTVTTQSNDPNFDALPTQTITAFCEDNDVAGVTIATASSCGCDEYLEGTAYTDTVLCTNVTGTGQTLCFAPERNTGLCAATQVTCLSDPGQASRYMSSVVLDEGNEAHVFTLNLLSVPTSTTTVQCTSSVPGRVSVSLEEDTLEPNENSTINDMVVWLDVAAIDDDIDHNTTSFTVACSFNSADSHYDGLSRVFIRGAATDNDVASIIYSPLSAKTYESDTTADPETYTSITVRLATQPLKSVVLATSLSADAPANITSGQTLTFTEDNWNVDQYILLQGSDDDQAIGSPAQYNAIVGVSSSDPSYGTLSGFTVVLQNIDNDAAGISIIATSAVTAEDPQSPFNPAEFLVVLQSEPLYPVVVACETSDSSAAVCSDSSVTFTASNWDVVQTFQVTGVNNAVAGTDQVYTVTIASSSSDESYDAVVERFNMTNLNDDIEGVEVTYSQELVTSEDSGSLSVEVCIVLESEPTADVAITALSQDTTEGLVDGAESSTLTFSAVNWDTLQCVSVSGQPDSIQDGNIAFDISFSVASSDDSYNDMDIQPLLFVNLDVDVSGFTVARVGAVVTTSETGASANLTVVLTSQPSAPVLMCGVSTDTTEAEFQNPCVTFTTANWAVPQILTVSGLDDNIVDGPIDYNATIYVAESTDTNYATLPSQNLVFTNFDNDVAAISVTQSGVETSELGGTQTITIMLDAEPFDTVTIALASSDTAEGVVQPTQLTFSPSNFDEPQTATVMGVADNLDDGNQAYNVSFVVASTDSNYDALVIPALAFTNTDDDTAQVLASVDGLQTYESGQAVVTLSVSLATQPFGAVTIVPGVSDSSEAAVLPLSLAFDPSNYNITQQFTITGLPDNMVDGDVDYSVVLTSSGSASTEYAALSDLVFDLTNIDADEAGLVVNPRLLFVTEAGSTRTISVLLNSKPLGDVVVTAMSSDVSEAAVSAPLTFTSDNWNVSQAFVVTGTDDAVADGESLVTISVATTSSVDSHYNNTFTVDVLVYNEDDDAVALVFSSCAGSVPVVSEGRNATACFQAVLSSEPVSFVTVTVSTSLPSAGTMSPTSLVFGPSNWSTPQQSYLSSIDDNFQNGNSEYCVSASTSSSDTAYDALRSPCINSVTTDNDVAALVVTPANEHVVITEGQGGVFTLELNSAPENGTAIVTASIPESSTANLTSSVFVFTDEDWNVPQDVEYQTKNDATVLGFGALDFHILFSSNTSNDPVYASVDDVVVHVLVTENNTAGVSVSATSAFLSEGSSDVSTVSVSLDSEPIDNVTVTCSSSDPTEAIVLPAQLVFSTSAAQALMVTSVNDNVADGPQPFAISCTVSSSDSNYDKQYNFTITGTNADDDSAGLDVSINGTVTTEAGQSQTMLVRLDSEPTATVSVIVESSDSAEGTASPTVLTFGPGNYSAAQAVQVEGQADCFVDGTVVYNVTLVTASLDANYDALSMVEMFTNLDDNYMSLSVSSDDVVPRTTESGTCITLTASLSASPHGAVSLRITTSDGTEGRVFNTTSGQWSTSTSATIIALGGASCADPTTAIQVCGQDDAVDDGNIEYEVVVECIGVADSRDSALVGSVVSTTVVNEDDDRASISLSRSALVVLTLNGDLTSDESGNPEYQPDNGDLFLRLTSQPMDSVVATVSCNDDTEVMLRTDDDAALTSSITLVIEPESWTTWPRIVYQGIDDDLVDGTIRVTCTVALESDDISYNGIVTTFRVNNYDNDVAGAVARLQGAPLTTEGGTGFEVEVTLTAQPTDTVTVSAGVSDAGQATVVPASIDIEPEDWDVPVEFRIRGVDNKVVDGTVGFVVDFSTSSSDIEFSGLSISSVAAFNADDDVAGFTATVVGNATTGEAGITCCRSTAISVVLSAEPFDEITISACTTREASLSAIAGSPGQVGVCADVVFSPSNYNIPQLVYVTGADDDIDNGNQFYQVTLATSPADSVVDSAFVGKTALINLVNIDDDVAGVTIQRPLGPARVYEGNSSTYDFTVVLNSEPVGPVTITVAADDESEGVVTVAPTALLFTSADWSTPQTVAISSVDNNIDEGDTLANVVFETSSTDTNYVALSIEPVEVLRVNDDIAALVVQLSAGQVPVTTEDGVAVTFDVVLTAEPEDTVSFLVTVSNTNEATVVAGSGVVTFTPQNYDVVQQVEIAGVPDNVVDGTVMYSVDFEAAPGTVYGHDGVPAAATYLLSNTDVDFASLVIERASMESNVDEDGSSVVEYSVSLSSKPTSSVSVVVQVSNTKEVLAGANGRTGGSIVLNFDGSNWNTVQTLSLMGVDDSVVDGPQVVNVAFLVVSDDTNYDGLATTPLSIINVDNDVAGITIDAEFSVGYVSESQAGLTFTLALLSEPIFPVNITVLSSDIGIGSISRQRRRAQQSGGKFFTFDASNWQTPQIVTVTATDTAAADVNVDFEVSFSIESDDDVYDGFILDPLVFQKIDLTTVGIVRTVSGSTTYEDSTQSPAEISIAVLSQPLNDVVITVASTNEAEGLVSPAQLIFSSENWDTPQTVTVTGVDDLVDDGNNQYNVTFVVASEDSDYDGSHMAPVTFTNVNNDVAGVTGVIQGSVVLYEAIAQNNMDYGDNDQPALCVSLVTQPVADTVAVIEISDSSKVEVVANSLTFTSNNWANLQCFAINPIDNDRADGDVVVTATVSFASEDPNYNMVDSQVASQTYTVVDNDYPGFTLSATSVVVREGAIFNVTVVLESEPFDAVVVDAVGFDSTQISVHPPSISFDASNWNSPRAFTIEALLDRVDDGDVLTEVKLLMTSSDDGYNALSSNVTVEAIDVDVAGIAIIEPESGATVVSEEGDTESFGIRLLSKPTAAVTIFIESSDATECALDETSLTFTADNWDVAATVTVQGLDDFIFDQDQPCTVFLTTITSSDPLYTALPVVGDALIQFINNDDDEAGIVCVPLAHTTSEATLTSVTSIVKLKSQPLSEVTISYSSQDPTEGTASGVLVLDETNWLTGVEVVITPVDDNLADGPQTYSVVFGSASSAGADYADMVPGFEIVVTNLDDDYVGMMVQYSSEKLPFNAVKQTDNFSMPTAFCNEENATSFTVSVQLTSEPYDDVNFTLSLPRLPSEAAAATREVPAFSEEQQIILTPSTWSEGQSLTLSCERDFYATGDQSFTIPFSVASADRAYDAFDTDYGLDPAELVVVVEDIDEAGVIVTLGEDGTADRLDTNSTGRSDTATFVLTSKPFGDITLNLVSKAASQGQLSTDTLTFSTSDWSTPQSITVTGLDSGDDTAQLYDISVDVSSSDGSTGDKAYDAIAVANIKVLNGYPTTIQVSEVGFASFGEFASSTTGLYVWIAIAVALLLLIILVIIIVVNRAKHKKEIEKERLAAVDARESMLAGADEVKINWSADDGIEMSNVDSIKTYEREYDGIVRKLQREAARLQAQNSLLAAKVGAEPLALDGAESSTDVMKLFSVIRELKASNSDFETRESGQGNADTGRLLKKDRKKRKKQATFGQSQI